MRGTLRSRLDDVERSKAVAAARAERSERDASMLRRALDTMPQAVVICDEMGEVMFRNRQAAALVAARHSDALAARAIEELLSSARRGQPTSRTLELHGPPPRSLVLTGSPMSDRYPSAAMAVIEDVSERRHLEAVRRDFVANVSHELRTPVGALGVLAETLGGEQDVVVMRRLADRISDEVDRVARIIEDLLDLSGIEAEVEPERVPVALSSVVAGAVDRVRPLAQQSDVEIVVREERMDLTVRGHERQLVSAIANLLDNAVKYSDPAAVVDVGADLSGDGAWVEIVVRDEGIGIPTRDLERIFERFYRVDRARSRQTGGTGLGLAIVRHIANNHGGDVLVESREGEGSTFTFSLPGDNQ
jgi:two-component system sensor histidine kinase SenX3